MRYLLSLLVLLALASTAGAADLESRAKKLEGLIMAPCCGGGTVADHPSPASDQARRDIRRMLADGLDEQQILDAFVAEHGETILAMPPARGFNLVAYWLPFLALLVGGAFLYVAIRQWRSGQVAATARAAESPAPPVAADAAAYEERVRRQLDALD